MSDTKTRSAAFESESHRLAAATFGAARTPNQPSGERRFVSEAPNTSEPHA